MSSIYFLDAQTNDRRERITSFDDGLEGLARDFQAWVREKHIRPGDIWYADVFEHIAKGNDRHAYTFTLQEDGSVLIHVPEKPVKNPYKRKKGLFR